MGMQCELFSGPEDAIRRFEKDFDLAVLTELENVGLEKSWHGIHFTLTGDPWLGSEPLNFLLNGGLVTDDDEDAPRVFDAAGVARIHSALQGIDDSEFARRFDVKALESHDIYPNIWEEDAADLLEEYRDYFDFMKQFVSRAAQSGHWLLVSLG